MKRYYTYTVKKIVTVQHLVTIEYLQIGQNFSYPEENHDFYEFVYVESGQVLCNADKEKILLNEHDFFLLSPGTSHFYSTDSIIPATIVIVCFKSKSNMISTAKGIHHLTEDLRTLMDQILTEAKATFVLPFDKKLTLSSQPRLGSQQLIENYIEEMLIKLIQKATYKQENIQVLPNNMDIKYSIAKEIKQILADNLYTRITLSHISRHMLYSKTYINDIFKEITGFTVMQYYQNLKIKKAMELIQHQESISSVSEMLCFTSPQYFSRIFKQKTGQSPSQYKKRCTQDR